MPATKTNSAERAGATTGSGRKSDLPLVVVAGATGHIGSQVVKELVKSGKFRVRAIVRPKKDEKPSSASAASATPATSSSSSAVAARLSKLGAEIWHGDVTEPATIAGCCEGASAAVSALGVRSFDRRDGSVWSVDRDGTLAFFEQARLATAVAAASSTPPSSSSAAAAAAAPSSLPPPAVLRVFVMVATFEGKESRRAEAISEAKEEAVDRVVAAARAMEAAARGAAAASNAGAAVVSDGGGRHETPKNSTAMKVRVLRPTAYFRDMSSWLLEPLLTGNKKDVVLTGDGGTRINPVDGRDVAKLVREEIEATAITSSSSTSSSSSSSSELVREIPVGGPQVFTLRSMAALAAEVAAAKLRAAAAASSAAAAAAAAAAASTSSTFAAAADAAPSSSSTTAVAPLHRPSPKPQELPPQIVIRSRPLWPLKLLAPLAALLAPCFGAAAALSDGARFVLYSATHDAVAEPSYGASTLRRYLEERADTVLAAAERERARGARKRRVRAATTASEGGEAEGGGDGGEGAGGGAGTAAVVAKAEGGAAPPAPAAAP